MGGKLEKCGEKLFVVIPDEAIAQLGWGHGDVLAVEVVGGGVKVVRTMTAHDHAMEIARKVMDKYSETLAALAKT